MSNITRYGNTNRINPATVKRTMAQLRQRAQNGDQRAAVKLAQINAAMEVLRAPMAPPQPQQIVGEDEEEAAEDAIYSVDELDVADRLAQDESNADELIRKSKLRQHRSAALAEQAPWSRTNPPSLVGQVLGQQIEVSASGGNGTKGDAKQCVTWVGADDSECTPVQISVWPVTQVITGDLNGGVRPFALVKWGNRSVMSQIEVDVAQGCQLSVAGSSVAVLLGLDGSGLAGQTETMLLSAMLSVGSVYRGPTACTRTSYIVLANNTTSIPVPPYARSVIMYRDQPAAVAVDLFFVDSNDTERYWVPVAAGAQMTDPVLIANDITQVQVRSTAVDVNCRLIFLLSV